MFPETSKGSYIAALIHSPDNQLSFSRAGDGKWIWLPLYTAYEDCSYSDGLLYAITLMGAIHAFDIDGPVIMRKIVMGMMLNDMIDCTCIVHAPWGDLLNVQRIVEVEEDANVGSADRVTNEIKIKKVDTRAKKT